MTTLTIHDLDPALEEELRRRAATNGVSIETEARQILQSILIEWDRPSAGNLYERIRARFAPLCGVDDLELPPREPTRELPSFE